MGTVLGVDYGDVRTGIALTDAEQAHALAAGVVEERTLPDIVRAVADVVRREGVTRIVVGLPLRLDGTEGEQAQKTRAFVAALQEVVTVPIELLDERFTTHAGEEAARAKGTPVDSEAARAILQTWLDRRNA